MAEHKEWKPELGSMKHPKTVDSSKINRGDILQLGPGMYYQAKVSASLQGLETIPLPNKCATNELDKNWIAVQKGSFLWPNDYHKHIVEKEDEIFRDGIMDKYYIAICDKNDGNSLKLKQIDIKENWMYLSSPFIGCLRLCDLLIPGVHDSGTYGTNENSPCLAQDIQKLHQTCSIVAADWNCTQAANHKEQLEAGFRNLDLRIAYIDGEYRWWHHLAGNVIIDGLHQIAEFAAKHPKEILFLDFQHFTSFDSTKRLCTALNADQFKELIKIIATFLGQYFVPKNIVSSTSTVSELYKTGKNIIAFMQYETDSNLFWPKTVLHSDWVSAPNPELLFVNRSDKLKEYKKKYSEWFTDISGCVSPEDNHRLAALKKYCKQEEDSVVDRVKDVFPACEDVDTDNMGFEGMFGSLLEMARYGVNADGMSILPAEKYNQGNSVHYKGVNDMYRHWLSRPNLYKPNIMYVDDAVHSSTIVETAIQANLGNIKREVAITNQGSHLQSKQESENSNDKCGIPANSVKKFKITINSELYNQKWEMFLAKEFIMIEDEYPSDAILSLHVGNRLEEEAAWQELYSGNIQEMIEKCQDLYIRGNDKFVYISEQYDLFTDGSKVPDSGCLAGVQL